MRNMHRLMLQLWLLAAALCQGRAVAHATRLGPDDPHARQAVRQIEASLNATLPEERADLG